MFRLKANKRAGYLFHLSLGRVSDRRDSRDETPLTPLEILNIFGSLLDFQSWYLIDRDTHIGSRGTILILCLNSNYSNKSQSFLVHFVYVSTLLLSVFFRTYFEREASKLSRPRWLTIPFCQRRGQLHTSLCLYFCVRFTVI